MSDVIDDPRILINPNFLSKLSINISQCAENFSIRIPEKLKTEKIIVDPDDITYINNRNEQIKPSLMGTLIDYLTRIVICNDKSAFDFLCEQHPSWYEFVEAINEAFADDHVYTSYNIEPNIKKLNIHKVQTVLEMCKHEQYFRSGNLGDLKQEYTIDDELLKHIKKLLMRNKKFFDKFGKTKIIGYHSHFGEKTDPVKYYGKPFKSLHVFIKGDGDYLLSNALMDLKVSSSNSDKSFWKKQLLLYYLGLDKEELEENNVKYKNIKYLINFNPRYNIAYKIYLQPNNTKLWFNIEQNIYLNIKNLNRKLQTYTKKLASDLKVRTMVTFGQAQHFRNPFLKYEDGIHQITREEYESIYNVPKTKGQLFLIKRQGFYMFLLKHRLTNGKYHLNILNGGAQQHATHDLQYYYDNLFTYGHTIELAFKNYQAFLVRLGSEVRLLAQSNYSDAGHVHGSIVDIDFYNHIYVDPMTGKMKFYYAPSVSERIVYPSFHSLLKNSSVDLKELIVSNLKLLPTNSLLKLDESYHLELSMSEHTPELLTLKDSDQLSLKMQQNSILDSYVVKPEHQYDQEMYNNSRAMTKIQKVLLNHQITFWNDQIIKDALRINEPKLNYRYRKSKSKVIDDASKASAYLETKHNKKIKQSDVNTIRYLAKKDISKENEQKINHRYQRTKVIDDMPKASAYLKIKHDKKVKQSDVNTIHYLTKKDISKYSEPNGQRIKIKKINNLRLASALEKPIKSARIILNNYACFDKNRMYLLSLNRNKLYGTVSSSEQKMLIDLRQNMKQLFKYKLYNAHVTKMTFVKDKNGHNIAYYDLGFDNKLFILDLIKDFKINQTLIDNMKVLHKTTDKEIYLYKVALGKLYKLN